MTTIMLPIQTYHVVAHEAKEGGYWAEVLELSGCVSQGETLEELDRNVREAIEAVLGSEPQIGPLQLRVEPNLPFQKDVWVFVADAVSGTVSSPAEANQTWTAAV
jgi:predicted RNase H-like HicB family nuclease